MNDTVGRITQLIGGAPVPQDRSHAEIDPQSGMQRDYVVLSAEERAKGFVKPVRRSYVHQKCGASTQMARELAETYARDPRFYTGTFCVACRTHFPINQFLWEDGEPMDPELQDAWTEQKAEQREGWRKRRIADLRNELAALEAANTANK
jgi:hypothetical protein